MGMKPGLEVVGMRTLVQFFEPGREGLSVVSLLMATFRNQVSGHISITVHKARPAASSSLKRMARFVTGNPMGQPGWEPGEVVGQLSLSGRAVEDNERVDVPVAVHAWESGQIYAIKIKSSGAARGAAATAWLADDQQRIPGHIDCFMGIRRQGEYGLVAFTLFREQRTRSTVPPAVLFSPVTQCNLNCIHCISRHTRTSVSHFPASLRARLRELSEQGKVEFLATDYSGDILWADHRFGGELDYLFSLGIPFHIDTNGAYLTRAISEKLARSKLRSVNVSLDAATDETFRRVRKGAPPLPTILQNIRDLVDVRRSMGGVYSISISFTLMASTLHEWPDFIRMAASLGVDHVHTRHLEAYTEAMERESLWHDKERYNTALRSVLELAEGLGVDLGAPSPFNDLPPRRGHKACPEPWRSAVILGNGDVAACCVPGMVMGNLNEESLEDIWNGPRYQRLRETVNSVLAPEPCQSCPMYRIKENRDSYLIYSAQQRGGVLSKLSQFKTDESPLVGGRSVPSANDAILSRAEQT